jgi:DNA-binding transcriptional ArsR family regulator
MVVSSKPAHASKTPRASRSPRASKRAAADERAMGMPSPQLLEEFGQFFRLLSEPARLQLLCQLKQGPMDVASLIEATGFSQSHISRQLGQLLRAGLVSCERDGVRLIYRADDQLVQDLCALVQNRLRQRLETQLQHLQAG